MKIIIDLQCCQTGAQSRGMGRYSASLAKEIVKIGMKHDFMFLLNSKYLPQSKDIIDQLRSLGKIADVIYYDYPDVQRDWKERAVRDDIASLLRNNRIESVSPDLYHISSLFEGESVFGAAAAFTRLPRKPALVSATLYDFIPYIYPSQYLANWEVKNWYQRTLSVARNLDIGLAISAATKTDAERLLQVPEQRIVNILGSVDERFRILQEYERQQTGVHARLRLDQPYILYVGGPDPRKNIYGTLQAFARLRSQIKSIYKLVLVYDVEDDQIAKLRTSARQLGIVEDIVISGFVTDDELVELYNGCTLFVFPSLYEGLGLPVIEAMRCGAPVLVGDNSSQRELVDNSDYRFDASTPDAIAEAMGAALADPSRLAEMRTYAVERSKAFTWERAARITLDTWEEAHAERVHADAGHQMPLTPARSLAKPKLAMFTPLPDAITGIADYSADFIPELSRYADLDIFVEDVVGVNFQHTGGQILHHQELPARANRYDVIVYQLGNSPFHHYMLSYIQRFPGVVVLHDAYLGHLSHDPGTPTAFVQQAIRDHGGEARAIIQASSTLADGVRRLIADLSCSPTHVHRSIGAIVHSHYARNILYSDSNPAISGEITVLPQYVAPIANAGRKDRAAARARLGLPADKIVIASFGHVAPTKGLLELIAGFRASDVGRSGRAVLVFVGDIEGGSASPTEFSKSILAAAGSDVVIAGHVDANTYNLYLSAIDFGVQLRTVSRGETSRAMLTLVVNTIPLIHNRLGAAAELPDDVALGLDSLAPALLAAAIDRLAVQSDLRTSMADAAQSYTREILSGEAVAPLFLKTVLRMAQRAQACYPNTLASEVAQVLSTGRPEVDFSREIAAAFVKQERAESRPRLLIDVTHIRENDLRTGVQRVVREFTRAAYTGRDRTSVPQAFAFTANEIVFADDYAQISGARCEVERNSVRQGALALRPFDQMLLADGSWHLNAWMRAPLERLKALGGSAFALIHDILPLQRPDLFHDHVTRSIADWLALMAEHCEGLICTSRTASDDLIVYLKDQNIPVKSGLRIGWAHLGADPLGETSSADAPVQLNLPAGSNIYLVVGTIEPRKGHVDILNAFDRLWTAGIDATLVFVGKRGWDIDTLAAQMDTHPEAGRRFREVGFVEDGTLRVLYAKARAAIVGSIAEGFGLPIFEAAHFGTPLILSDLPVFRELAGEHARYFRRGSTDDLVKTLRSSILNPDFLLNSHPIAPPSWKKCFNHIEHFMRGHNNYHQF